MSTDYRPPYPCAQVNDVSGPSWEMCIFLLLRGLWPTWGASCRPQGRGGGGGWHKASVSICLPLAAPIGLSPLLILTLCGPERVLVVSTEPPDDLSCLTTPGVGRPGDGLLPVPLGGGGGRVLIYLTYIHISQGCRTRQ